MVMRGLSRLDVAIIVLCLFSAAGFWMARVIPSTVSIYAAHAASIVAGLFAARWQYRRIVPLSPRLRNDLGRRLLSTRPARMVFAVVAAYIAIWPMVAWTIPWIAAEAFGRESTMTVRTEGWSEKRRRGRCSKPLVVGAWQRAMSSGTFCGLGRNAARSWDGAVLLLEGRQGPLGFRVHELKVIDQGTM